MPAADDTATIPCMSRLAVQLHDRLSPDFVSAGAGTGDGFSK